MIIFMIRTKSNDLAVGFNGNRKVHNDLSNELLSKVSLNIQLNEPNKSDIKQIVINKLNNTIKRYNDIKIVIDDLYKEKLISIIEKEKNLSNIDSILEKEFESKIIDALVDYKKFIKFTVEESKIYS